jgi:hypothetical protein
VPETKSTLSKGRTEPREAQSELPVIIITTTGKSTGKLRKTPRMRVEHGGRYAAVASMAGAPPRTQAVPQHEDVAAGRIAKDGAVRQAATTRRIPVMLLEPLSPEGPT